MPEKILNFENIQKNTFFIVQKFLLRAFVGYNSLRKDVSSCRLYNNFFKIKSLQSLYSYLFSIFSPKGRNLGGSVCVSQKFNFLLGTLLLVQSESLFSNSFEFTAAYISGVIA